MGGGQRPEPGVNGNWECEECKNVNFPRRWACYTMQSVVHLLYLKQNRKKMAGQREQGGNFHYDCRLHGGHPRRSYLKWVHYRIRAHHGLVWILVARGYVTLYESLAICFRIMSRLAHPQESRIRKYMNLLTEYAFPWWHSYILICTCCEVSMTAVGSGGNLWIAYMMEVMVGTLSLNVTQLLMHIFCCKSFDLTCTDRPPCKMILWDRQFFSLWHSSCCGHILTSWDQECNSLLWELTVF